MRQTGDYQGDQPLTPDRLQHLFRQAVDELDVEQARGEVAPFIRDRRALEVWDRDFFKQIIKWVAYLGVFKEERVFCFDLIPCQV